VKPECRDSEILTLLLAQDFILYPGETQFVAYIRANHLGEFPKLVYQSHYNRRARQLSPLEALRQEWVKPVGSQHGPAVVIGY